MKSLVTKRRPTFRDIFVKDGTHVEGFLVTKQPIGVAHPCMSNLYVYPTPKGFDLSWMLQKVVNTCMQTKLL